MTDTENPGARDDAHEMNDTKRTRLEILEPVDGTTPQRYRFDEESAVSQGIIDLNGRINAAGDADDSVGNE